MSTVADHSFLLFIYPFLFDRKTFRERVRAIEASTVKVVKRTEAPPGEDREKSIPFWTKVSRFPRDEMLAYIADYLNPRELDSEATAQIWVLNEELENLYGLFGKAEWALKAIPNKGPWPFEFGTRGGENWAVHLMLFRDGVGFLSFRIRPISRELDDWLNVLHYFRFVKGQRRVSVSARSAVGYDEKTKERLYAPFFPTLAGGREALSGRITIFDAVLESLLRTAGLNDDSEHWWRDVFVPEQLIPFAALFLEGADPANDLRIAYKLRHFFRPSQANTPAAEDLAPAHPSLFAYAERQWFTFSLAGGSFLSCDASDNKFLQATMPYHLRDLYFLVLLLAMHQRFKLMDLSEQVAKRWLAKFEIRAADADRETRLKERYEAFQEIRDQFLEFTARGYFAQIMQHEHHHRFYRKWHEVFQVSALYDEVLDEVREMYQFLQERRAEQIREATKNQQAELVRQTQEQEKRARDLSMRISILTSLVVVPAIVFGFLGINIRHFTAGAESGLTKLQAVLWSAGGILGLAIVAYVVLEIIRKRVDRAAQAGAPQSEKLKDIHE